MIETWIHDQSTNSDESVVVRLTKAKSRIPAQAFVTGNAPDPNAPPPGHKPISIVWPDGVKTKHFVRKDTNRYMITDRSHATEAHLVPYVSLPGQIAITALSDGEFVISPVQTK